MEDKVIEIEKEPEQTESTTSDQVQEQTAVTPLLSQPNRPEPPLLHTPLLPTPFGLLDLRKLSSSSSDCLPRKMSNDSGVSALSSSDMAYTDKECSSPPPSSAPHHQQLIGEPRLASTQQFLAQQSGNGSLPLNAATTGYLGLQPNAMLSAQSHLWSNPLLAASLLQQQQEAARKFLETTAANAKPPMRPFKPHASKDISSLPLASSLYSLPGFLPPTGNLPAAPVADTSALAHSIKLHEQMINAYKLQFLHQSPEEPVKATRKAHSFSGDSSSPSAFTNVGSPSTPLQHRLSPGSSQRLTGSGDEKASSYQGEDDRLSVGSNKSSLNSFDIKCSNSIGSSQCQEAVSHLVTPAPPPASHQSNNNGRRRKLGVIGTSGCAPTLTDLTYISGSQSTCSSLSTTPTSKISTTSLPANLTGTQSATTRKRPHTLAEDVKDESYWERRRKNNEAAKRSRDSRRAKEDEIAMRAAYLEQENLRLREAMVTMKRELNQLRDEVDARKKKKEAIAESEPTPPTSPPTNES